MSDLVKTRALTIAAALLESDEWRFKSTLTTARREIYASGYGEPPDVDEAELDLSIDWETQFDVRSYGIKDISVVLLGIHLTGALTNLDTGPVKQIDIRWPTGEKRPPGNPDEPTQDMAVYMALPTDWNVTWKRHRPEEDYDTSIYPTHADVDLQKHTIEIEF